MSTKVQYIEQLHKIFLLHSDGFDFYTVYVLMSGYISRFNIMYQEKPKCEECFMRTVHDSFYYDFQNFSTLCAEYLDFSDAGTLFQRAARKIEEFDAMHLDSVLTLKIAS